MGKNLENRTWSTSYRGPLLIHASRTILREDFLALCSIARKLGLDPDAIPEPADLPRQAAVGVCMLVDVVTRHRSPWFSGPRALVLDQVQPLARPIPMPGRQKLWRV